MKKGIFLCLLFLGFIPISCLKGSCRGEKLTKVKDFRITRFGLITTDLNENIVVSEAYHPVDSIYKMLFILDKKDVAALKPTTFSFATPLYACDPAYPIAVNFIAEINIIAKNNFTDSSESIVVGDNITDKFEFIRNGGRPIPLVPLYYTKRMELKDTYLFKSKL